MFRYTEKNIMENNVKLISSISTGAVITVTFLLFSIFFNGSLHCQIKTSKGSYQVRIESNLTKTQARDQARQLAMINAIEKVFGTYVEQETDLFINNNTLSYNIIGTTKVRGEWVKTLDINYSEENMEIETEYGKETEVWITCKITGRIKKSVPKANILFQTLNCPDIKCRTVAFLSGESFYLHFKSPVKGYLCLFLYDNDMVYRILPYNEMNDKMITSVHVEADKDYIFFTKEKDYFQDIKVDEYELFTEVKIDYNTLYIIFAEEPYVKPILTKSQELEEYKEDYRLPKSLYMEEFNNWLSNNRAEMDSFQDKKVKLSIKK